MPRALLILVPLLLGLSVGVWLGSTWEASRTARPQRSMPGIDDDFVLPGVAGDVRRVLLEADPLVRVGHLAELLASLGPESLAEVQRAYTTIFFDVGEIEYALLGEWWASFAPEEAFLWTRTDYRAKQLNVTETVLRRWAHVDPEQALVAAHTADSPPKKRRWIDAVIRGWDESQRDGALEYMRQLPAGRSRQWAIAVAMRRMVLRDGAQSSIEWAEALPDKDKVFKLNVYRRLTSALAQVDPDSAVAFAERHLNGPFGDGLPRRVATRWVQRDPVAAMEWLSTLPAGPNRDDGVLEAYRDWHIRDAEGARQWLRDSTLVPWLDPAVSIYARQVGLEDPEQGIAWAMKISDEDLRLPTLGRVARTWLLMDEAAANAWLDASGLPEDFVRRTRIVPEGMRKGFELHQEQRRAGSAS